MSASRSSSKVKLDAYLSFPVIAHQNPWLDLLRSLAIILVLLRHAEQALPHSGAALGIFSHNFFTNGWVGVDLFLVLSGYLIANSLSKTLSPTGQINMGRYLKSRAFRIIPAYVAVLFLVIAGAFPFYQTPSDVTGWTVLYHLLFLQDYLPSHINVVFWSLGVEEKFYLIAPLLIILLSTLRKWQAAAFILFCMLAISPISKLVTFNAFAGEMTYGVFFQTLRSPFHQTLEPLLIGVLVSVLERRSPIQLCAARARALLLFSAMILIVWLASHDFHAAFTPTDLIGQPLGLSALFGLMVFCALALADKAPIGTRLWRPVARLSYALYLVHYPLIPLCLAAASTSSAPQLTFWAFFITLSFAAALALHFVIEKPFLLLKDRIGARKTTTPEDTKSPANVYI